MKLILKYFEMFSHVYKIKFKEFPYYAPSPPHGHTHLGGGCVLLTELPPLPPTAYSFAYL